MVRIERLDWDSNFFGIEIGRVDYLETEELNLKEIYYLVKDSSFDLVYIFEKIIFFPKSFLSAQYLVDTKVLFVKNSDFCNDDTIEVVSYHELNEPVVEELYSLALDSGAYSRFKTDKRFRNSDFIKLYRKWVDNCLRKDICNDLFVYVENEHLLGFITVNYSNEVATIGLIAVNKYFRGKSIGSKLMKKVEHSAIQNGCLSVVVATQLENKQACSFYERNGYEISEMKNIYHIWK